MRLYIAEKPSMGREIAACLTGPIKKGDGFLATREGVVTWLFGHILRQAEPHEYDPRYRKWQAEDLPIVPQSWKLLVDKNSVKQFEIVRRLIGEADEIVHAGDPDREGQLLVDEVLDYLGNKKPVRRILLNALDEASIKKAKNALRDNQDFLHLKESALARARADWLIGMNLSRAYTLAARRAGHQNIVLPIGRVKTPTLALVVRREREIKNFKSVDYFAIKGEFIHANGNFWAEWKPKDEQPGLDSENRLIDEKIAKAKLDEFMAEPHRAQVADYQRTKQKELAPLPFALSSLQVLAGKRYGYEPQTVLDTAQRLYEKKLTTYPRSDSEYLPQNQFADAPKIIGNLTEIDHADLSVWAKGADSGIKSRAWNDEKISAHHAIIPTTVKANMSALNEPERNIYLLIARAFLAQFYPPHFFYQSKVSVNYKEENFIANGRTEISPGWKIMYPASPRKDNAEGKDEEKEENVKLPMMKKNDALDFAQGKIIKRATKPPQRFTPSTLLAGMKEIHKYVKDPAAKKQLKDVYGIGTEATRAAIIDDLIKRRFVEPEGKKKYLIPQPSAYLLIDILPDDLTYPDATAIWEDRLHSLSEGDGTLEDFLERQVEFTAKLCQAAEKAAIEPQGEYVCPRCKRGVMVRRHGKNGDFWGCSTYPKCRMTCDDKAGKPNLEHSSGASRINVSAESGTIYNSYSDKVDYSELPPPSYPSETEIADYYAGKF